MNHYVTNICENSNSFRRNKLSRVGDKPLGMAHV